jgi:hypothetical protein
MIVGLAFDIYSTEAFLINELNSLEYLVESKIFIALKSQKKLIIRVLDCSIAFNDELQPIDAQISSFDEGAIFPIMQEKLQKSKDDCKREKNLVFQWIVNCKLDRSYCDTHADSDHNLEIKQILFKKEQIFDTKIYQENMEYACQDLIHKFRTFENSFVQKVLLDNFRCDYKSSLRRIDLFLSIYNNSLNNLKFAKSVGSNFARGIKFMKLREKLVALSSILGGKSINDLKFWFTLLLLISKKLTGNEKTNLTLVNLSFISSLQYRSRAI